MVTVLTRTIASSGGDYASFSLASADIPNIGTSLNFVANDEAIVFEVADETFDNGGVAFNIASGGITADATRNVSFVAASGGNPKVLYSGASNAVRIFNPYTVWDGIDVDASAGTCFQIRANSGYGSGQHGTTIKNAVLTAAGTAIKCDKIATNRDLGSSTEPITLINLVTEAQVVVSQFISGTGHVTDAHMKVVNCTHLGNGTASTAWTWSGTKVAAASFTLINCANVAPNATNDINITAGGVDISGSSNNIGNANAADSSLTFANEGIGTQLEPTTNTSPGAGNFAIIDSFTTGQFVNSADNDALDLGVGPDSNSDVPLTGILGFTRRGTTTQVGAYALLFGQVDPPELDGTPTVTAISDTEATINWTTTTAATSQVVFGTTSGVLSTTVSGTAGVYVTSHSLTLTGLTPETQHFFRLEGVDNHEGGVLIAPTEFTFTTIATPVVEPEPETETEEEEEATQDEDIHQCLNTTADGSPIPCGPPSRTLEEIQAWNGRARKLFVISIGQSNNGLTSEPGTLDPVLDAPNPDIYELSQGIGYEEDEGDEFQRVGLVEGRPWVADSGERHVFEHPAQDDRGGMCMRLAGAKRLKQLFPTVTEVTLFCGAEGGSSLRRQWATDQTVGTGERTQATIAFCDAYMKANPDHDVIFWCSLGFTDGLEQMPAQEFQTRLTTLAEVLRSSIYGAERAFWVQGDIPQTAIDTFDASKNSTALADIAQLQKTVHTFIPLSASATMSDLSIYDSVHLDRSSLRTFGERMAAVTKF